MSIKSRISDKSPQIFLAVGIISFVGAVITAALKSEEVKPIFKNAKKDIKAATINEDRYGFKNETEVKLYKAKVATVAAIDISKTMAVSIGLTVFGTCCVCKSYKLMNNKQLALISGIDILDAGYKSLRETVKENVDEKTMQKIDDQVRAKNVSKQIDAIKKVDNHICNDVETFTRFFNEETSNKYPTGGADTVLPFLKSQETYFNQLLHIRGIVYFNEILDALGLPKNDETKRIYWESNGGKNFIDFGITGAYFIDYDNVLDCYNCIRDKSKIPRPNGGFILCFNADLSNIR